MWGCGRAFPHAFLCYCTHIPSSFLPQVHFELFWHEQAIGDKSKPTKSNTISKAILYSVFYILTNPPPRPNNFQLVTTHSPAVPPLCSGKASWLPLLPLNLSLTPSAPLHCQCYDIPCWFSCYPPNFSPWFPFSGAYGSSVISRLNQKCIKGPKWGREMVVGAHARY